MDKKQLINNLLLDLAQDASMNKVMLMAQAISFELYNDLFSDWVRKEQRGYYNCKQEEIPLYREFPCGLKVDIFLPYRGIVTNYMIPQDIIEERLAKDFLSSVKLPQSLAELEHIKSKNDDSELQLGVPASIFPYINQSLDDGEVQRATRVVSAAAPSAIINCVKAKLLDFFSYMSKSIDLDSDFQGEGIQCKLNELFNKYIWNE